MSRPTVLFLSPGFPAEMPWFVRGLARAGAHVVGIGEHPREALPAPARDHLAAHFQVGSILDEGALLEAARDVARRAEIDRVESLWEPLMLPAARLREALGVPGLTVEQTVPFRDKEEMKRRLDAAGLRTPRHARAASAGEVREAAGRIGYPLVVKPIAGAGSADTYRVDDPGHLERILPGLGHVAEVSVEEFVDGEELTFDTVTAGGRILFESICWYRPKPLIGRSLEWVSPQTVALRDPSVPHLAPGRELGRRVLEALGFDTGFTHMEWFLTPSGEAVFGEIAARPPGARSVDVTNYAADVDTFAGWGEAVVSGTWSQPVPRRHNAAVVFKRAEGQGRITRIEGLEGLLARYGRHVAALDLLPLGVPRRDWRQTLLSDGSVIVRHPDLGTCLEMADRFGTDLVLHAG